MHVLKIALEIVGGAVVIVALLACIVAGCILHDASSGRNPFE